MSLQRLTRRTFLTASGALAAAAGTAELFAATQPASDAPRAPTAPSSPAATPLEKKLDAYIAAYMPAMNAPGLTLGLTDTSKTIRAVSYGYANIESRLPVTPEHLFQIGSITKSFLALVLLQLRDEGKLDLHKPILDYLPWLPITEPFGPIATHHLLTHTSGLPDASEVFLPDSQARHAQGFTPGEHFHYCNLGFSILGQLAAKLDGRPWYELVKARILTPLGMNDTQPVITTATRTRAATGYQPFWDDEVYARQGRLAASGNLVFDGTAGCIESTPADMARYIRMMLNHGKTATGRIVSEEGFALFATPYIKAEEFSPTSSYGYGIAVDTLDGHKILRHTGGMVSFASSIHVDLDGGVAAFASINAMQGYRPTAVTQYAVQLLRADHESKPLPAPTPLENPEEVKNAADYAGTFTAADGSKLVFQVSPQANGQANGPRLALVDNGRSIPLQKAGEDSFISTMSGHFATYGLIFKRVGNGTKADPKATLGKVNQVSYGSQWYANENYPGPKIFPVPSDYSAFAGHYRSDSDWGGDARVYVLQGKLYLSDSELTRIGGGLFHIGDEAWIPDTVEFLSVYEGKAHLVRAVGTDFWRIDIP